MPAAIPVAFFVWALLECGASFLPAVLAPLLKWAFLALTAGAVVVTLAVWLMTLGRDFRMRCFHGLIACAAATFVALSGIGSVDSREISHEASIQVATGLKFLAEPDGGVQRHGFFEYPARQYSVVALPALFFGRNLIALRAGYAGIFLLGLFVFYAGLRSALRGHGERASAVGASLGMLLPLCFGHLVFWLRMAEQSILPASLTLFALGWALLFASRGAAAGACAVGLGWTTALLPMCYPPALASVALLSAFVLWHGWEQRGRAHVLPAALGLLAILAIVSVTAFRLQIGGRFQLAAIGGDAGAEGMLERVLLAWRALFFDAPDGAVNAFAFPLVWVSMALALAGYFGWAGRVVGAWILLTVAAAVTMVGYTQRPFYFDLHRSLVIVPPLAVLGAALLARGWSLLPQSERPFRRFLGEGLAVAYGVSAVLTSLYFGHPTAIPRPLFSRPSDVIFADLAQLVREHALQPWNTLQVEAPESLLVGNTGDYASYFCPNAVFVVNGIARPVQEWIPHWVSPGTRILRVRYKDTLESPEPVGVRLEAIQRAAKRSFVRTTEWIEEGATTR